MLVKTLNRFGFRAGIGWLALLIFVVVTRGWSAPAQPAATGDEVVVVYNTRVPESKGVAEHYRERRQVPANQVIGLDLPDNESMSRGDYHSRLELPLLKALKQKKLLTFGTRELPAVSGRPARIEGAVLTAGIRYVVLCYGVPLKISHDPGFQEAGSDAVQKELRRDEAAVDSELACLPLVEQGYHRFGLLPNPFYGATNATMMNPTNGILLVARLDGPSASIARALVDKAMQAETDGLWGRAYIDLQGLTNGNYKVGDDWMRNAAEVSRRLGYETVVDEQPATFGSSTPLSQIALYAGWYNEHVSGPFALPEVEFLPGAFAYHLHSFSAATLRSTTHQWVGPLLARGATATMGCVDEPFLALTPDVGVFFARFLGAGFSFGEAAYAAQNGLSWQTTVVGDPLYRPCTRSPRQSLEELNARSSKLVEWPVLTLANRELANGAPAANIIAGLEKLSFTTNSSVLTEKLAELYAATGRLEDSIATLQRVLPLQPSHQQRIRVLIKLAERQIATGRDEGAYATYLEFAKVAPDFSDLAGIYRRLIPLAEKTAHKDAIPAFESEIRRLTDPAANSSRPAPSGK